MNIRNKIFFYFSSTVILLTAVSLSIIYILFSEYREEEFQQRQKEKIKHTIELLGEYKAMSQSLSNIMDRLTIHDFYDEKMLIFDKQKDLVYSSVDSLLITGYADILNALSPSTQWIETKEGNYDIVGVYIENQHSHFYAISKAYDNFGYSKLSFLRNTLIAIFLITVLAVYLISLFLSKKISKPITSLAERISTYRIDNFNSEIQLDTSTSELKYLNEKFNELLRKTGEAFAFQKHAVQHISHELKTPVSILVSELERIRNYTRPEELRPALDGLVNKAKSLGEIINVLLEISKIEAGIKLKKTPVRIDELIFDLIEELKMIHPDFSFELQYLPTEFDENRLVLLTDKMLIKQAFQNLVNNAVSYSSNSSAELTIDCSSPRALTIRVINEGSTISPEEEKYVFDHFFRGSNSQGRMGFGLGLILTKIIVTLHGGSIRYINPSPKLNVFEARFPLS